MSESKIDIRKKVIADWQTFSNNVICRRSDNQSIARVNLIYVSFNSTRLSDEPKQISDFIADIKKEIQHYNMNEYTPDEFGKYLKEQREKLLEILNK